LPQLPTVAEAGLPGFDVTSWYGVFGPAALPKEIVARLNSEIGAAITAPELTERLTALGAEPAVKTPACVRPVRARRNREMGENRQGVGREAGLNARAAPQSPATKRKPPSIDRHAAIEEI
jgi:hypothetical protein